jgi:hypothetical protein
MKKYILRHVATAGFTTPSGHCFPDFYIPSRLVKITRAKAIQIKGMASLTNHRFHLTEI